MTLALWCVLAAALLPVLCAGIAKSGFRDFDNHQPRAWLARQEGFRARANAAQQNSWEALAVFSAAVFTSQIAHAPRGLCDTLAVAFIVARLLYLGCYLADLATLRTTVWTIGLGLCIALFVCGA